MNNTKNIISKRNIWMAVAIIWVIISHFDYNTGICFLDEIKNVGYGGVDIFYFSSGLGCWFSLNKNNDAVSFIKRRAKKIVPTYLVFISFWIVFKILFSNINFSSVIGNLFFIQDLTGNGFAFNWYISSLWLFYLVAPYLFAISNKISKTIWFIVFVLLLIIFSFAFWNSKALIISVTRIPIFFIGMYCAKVSTKISQIKTSHIVLLTVSFAVGVVFLIYARNHYKDYLWNYGLYWYPFILITPPLCFYISEVSLLLDKNKFGRFIIFTFDKLGKYTFEIYLVHVFIIYILRSLEAKFGKFNSLISVIASLITTAIGVIILCFVTKLITNTITLLSKKQEKT